MYVGGRMLVNRCIWNLKAPNSRPFRPQTVWDQVPGFVNSNVARSQLHTLWVDKPTGWNREWANKSDLKSQDRDPKYVGYKRSPIEIDLTSQYNVTIRYKLSQSLLTKSKWLCSQEDVVFAKRINQGKALHTAYLGLDGPSFFSLDLRFVCELYSLRFLFLTSSRTSRAGHSKIDSYWNYLKVATCPSIGWSTSQK